MNESAFSLFSLRTHLGPIDQGFTGVGSGLPGATFFVTAFPE